MIQVQSDRTCSCSRHWHTTCEDLDYHLLDPRGDVVIVLQSPNAESATLRSADKSSFYRPSTEQNEGCEQTEESKGRKGRKAKHRRARSMDAASRIDQGSLENSPTCSAAQLTHVTAHNPERSIRLDHTAPDISDATEEAAVRYRV